MKQNGGPIDIVGWSLGGIMARLLALHHPDRVRQAISLGSPIRVEDPEANLSESVRRLSQLAGLQRGRRGHDLTVIPVPSTVIYSRQDGVVAPASCLQPVGPTSENIEVRGAHIGLGHNASAVWAVADRLAQTRWGVGPVRGATGDGMVLSRSRTRERCIGEPGGSLITMPTSQIQHGHSRLLAIETPTALGHTSTLTVVDAANTPHRLNAALLRQEVSARLDDHPMLRQSLVEVPLNLDRPWWRDHPGFDLNYHLRHIAVPDPDDPNSLAELVARIHSRPLDRDRPLWELYLISVSPTGTRRCCSRCISRPWQRRRATRCVPV